MSLSVALGCSAAHVSIKWYVSGEVSLNKILCEHNCSAGVNHRSKAVLPLTLNDFKTGYKDLNSIGISSRKL